MTSCTPPAGGEVISALDVGLRLHSLAISAVADDQAVLQLLRQRLSFRPRVDRENTVVSAVDTILVF